MRASKIRPTGEGRMCSRMMLAAAATVLVAAGVGGQGRQGTHLNPMIELHLQRKPIFGLYAPSNPRARGNRGTAAAGASAPVTPPPAPAILKTPAELAKEALAYDKSDFVFDGSMEGGVDRGIPGFTALVNALAEAPLEVRWRHPLSVKTPEIAPDPVKAVENISRQLNIGVTTIVFVGVESAEEVKQGLAAMRF